MKFICEECEKPCILEVGDCYNLTADVLTCVSKNSCYCKWKEVKGNQSPTNSSHLVTNCNRLPKLTAEVFDRPDCPEWAKWAAVNRNNTARWFDDKPIYDGNKYCSWICKATPYYNEIKTIPGVWDASDWQNSLIKRPAAKLPDWCKVGEWVYLCNGTYSRIVSINDCHVNLENGISVGKNSIHEEMVPARLRPYNEDEMRGLVGKAVCGIDGKIFLVVAYAPNTVLFGEVLHTPEDLTLDIYKFPDGSPCGCLEHLEEGEWVR